jgi:hypothetical protein
VAISIGGRDALAGYVGYREYHSIVVTGLAGAGKDIVVIAGHGISGACGIGNRDSRNLRRSARQQPGLNLARNLQVALHHHAVGDLEYEQKKEQKRGPEMEVEFEAMDFVAGTAIAKAAAGNQQHDQRDQQQHPARGRKLFQNRPKEFLDDMQAVSATGETLGCLRLNVAGVEPVAGARFGFELRPKLAELESFRDTLPEPLQTHPEPRAMGGSGFGWWGSGRHEIK